MLPETDTQFREIWYAQMHLNILSAKSRPLSVLKKAVHLHLNTTLTHKQLESQGCILSTVATDKAPKVM